MGKVLIIGAGVSGLSAAISLAERGIKSVIISPFPSERAQSVMAAGGINAINTKVGDSIKQHVEDTLSGGCDIAGREAIEGLCSCAPEIVRQLECIGMVFTRDEEGELARRAFGGQTYKRTCYSGALTGKHMVSAMVMKCRQFEASGLIERLLWTDFHSCLIKDGKAYGALIFNEATRELVPMYADAVIMATGGQNAMFGKTTGSTTCDGYAAGRLFMQGVSLKNLEFIQYHPTTIETYQKRMLVSEAARGEGGRLFYEKDGKRVYFMEDKFGPNGNLMPRDIVSKSMYELGEQVFLDVSFLGRKLIDERLAEVRDICKKYRGIDITKEPIPVEPSVHFFMGGIAVNNNHETNIKGLYAVGECASIYHGANRLGGNSLLAAFYGGQVAAKSIAESYSPDGNGAADFSHFASEETEKLRKAGETKSKFPVMYIRDMLAEDMNKYLGIARTEKELLKGRETLDFYLDAASKLNYDRNVLPYFNYSLQGILVLAKAVLVSAISRKETRGAHFRTDYPERDDNYAAASIISFNDGAYELYYDFEKKFEK